MDITLSGDNFKVIKVLPVVPPDIYIDEATNNESFKTMNGLELTLIGHEGARNVSIDSIFPNKDYPWLKRGSSYDGWSYVDFIKKYKKSRKPIRIIITSKSGHEILNMAAAIDSFSSALDQVGDIVYSLSLKEYEFVDVR